MTATVLLHGSWLGGWMWDDIATGLTADGHDVVAPTMDGSADLHEHRRELVGRIDAGDIAAGAVLVGHSYAGMVATAVAADRPAAVREVIYLDAYVPRDGQCAFDVLPDIKGAFEASATVDAMVPPLPLAAFGIEDAAVAAVIESRLRPWPLATHTQPSPGLPEQVDRVYLQCAQGGFFNDLCAELEGDGWTVERLDLAHLAPITHPSAVLDALRRYL